MVNAVKTGGLSFRYANGNESELLNSTYTLGLITYSPTNASLADPRAIALQMPSLSTSLNTELIEVTTPVTYGQVGAINWSRNDEFQLLSIRAPAKDDDRLDQVTYCAYRELLDYVKASDFPHPMRVWNFFGDINRGQGDDERYKKFCQGRLSAFESESIPVNEFPSASALGSASDELVILLISSKLPSRHKENPEQQSAYRYPKQYGPASPSFARATHYPTFEPSHFLISGTASISGHKSLFVDNVEKQTEKTLDNIELLIRTHCDDKMRIEALKVYIRHSKDMAIIDEVIKKRGLRSVPLIFLNADICRAELDVEIEGYCRPISDSCQQMNQ